MNVDKRIEGLSSKDITKEFVMKNLTTEEFQGTYYKEGIPELRTFRLSLCNSSDIHTNILKIEGLLEDLKSCIKDGALLSYIYDDYYGFEIIMRIPTKIKITATDHFQTLWKEQLKAKKKEDDKKLSRLESAKVELEGLLKIVEQTENEIELLQQEEE